MDDLISRQEAIDALDKIFPADPMRNDYTQGITCGAALATEYIKQLPSAQPTLYGYSIDHLALIAGVMEKEGVSPEEAMRFFKDTQRIYQMLVDEIQKQVEGMVESCVT